MLLTAPFKVIDVTDEESRSEGVAWWEALAGKGGEGMVVKPAVPRRLLVDPVLLDVDHVLLPALDLPGRPGPAELAAVG